VRARLHQVSHTSVRTSCVSMHTVSVHLRTRSLTRLLIDVSVWSTGSVSSDVLARSLACSLMYRCGRQDLSPATSIARSLACSLMYRCGRQDLSPATSRRGASHKRISKRTRPRTSPSRLTRPQTSAPSLLAVARSLDGFVVAGGAVGAARDDLDACVDEGEGVGDGDDEAGGSLPTNSPPVDQQSINRIFLEEENKNVSCQLRNYFAPPSA
jgi:hypothetical protein